jgi:hypothetical protein
MTLKNRGALFYNLEFTRFENATIFVAKLENIDTTVEVIQIDSDTWSCVLYFINFLPHEVEDEK